MSRTPMLVGLWDGGWGGVELNHHNELHYVCSPHQNSASRPL